MARGAEAGAGKDGRGKGVVEDTSVGSDDGEGLSGEGSGPRAFWAKFDKVRSNEHLGAQDSYPWDLVKFGLWPKRALDWAIIWGF